MNDSKVPEAVINATPVAEPRDDPFADHPSLEQEIRRVLDEHLELAFQEIKLALRRTRNKP